MNSPRILFVITLFMFLSIPGFSADTDPVLRDVPTESISVRMTELETRLNEIKVMDVKAMSRSERKALRKEVNAIEKEMKTMAHGGVYISVGAIIIIILLLILLL